MAEADQYKRLSCMADLARRGFVTAILQYRESNLATFPAQVQDAKTGIRFLRKHAEEYHIDVDNIFIMEIPAAVILLYSQDHCRTEHIRYGRLQ